MNRNTYIALIIFLTVVCTFLLASILNRRANMRTNVNSISAMLGRLNQSGKVDELLNLIDRQYVDTVDMQELTEHAMMSVMADLDPHSSYIPANDLEAVNDELEGSFSGIGVQFNIQNDTVMVVAVISGGPSEKVGLMPGDRIVEVDDSLFVGKNLVSNDKVLKKLRGAKNTQVKLGIVRAGMPDILHFTVTRGDIPITSVDAAYMVAPEVGFIQVSRFAATTYNEFLKGLATLRNQGAKKFIIDLRGNSGGLMDQTVKMVNEFLPRGQMIVYSEGKAYPRYDAKADGSGSFTTQPLIILIDEFSASASEIFAGAIQDNDRGLIVGRRSFGKGLVQTQLPLSDGSAVRLTVARYYTPSGRSIQKPYEMGKTEEYEEDLINRYLHGEFYSRDSIQMADTLVYYTPEGRIVYGGGGIMPDVFVPRDTTGYSSYLNKAIAYIYQYTIQYSDKNRSVLNQYKTRREMEKYLDKQPLLNNFVAFVEEKGVKPDWKDINQSKRLIERQLKAYIVRSILGEEDFYPLFNQDDTAIKQALYEFEHNELLKN